MDMYGRGWVRLFDFDDLDLSGLCVLDLQKLVTAAIVKKDGKRIPVDEQPPGVVAMMAAIYVRGKDRRLAKVLGGDPASFLQGSKKGRVVQ